MADLVKGKFKCRIDSIRNKGDNTHRYNATILEIIKKLADSANVNANDQVTLKIVHTSDKDSDYFAGGVGTFDGDENDIQTNSGNVKLNVRNNQPFSIPSDFTAKDKRNREQKMPNTDHLQEYIDLLRGNRNLILTGAPGTGKTRLAQDIAVRMIFSDKPGLTFRDLVDGTEEKKIFDSHYDFVQFHPSYDYTDFVEGLRPIEAENDNVGFELRNGIFKEFCKKAIQQSSSDDFDEKYDQFIDDYAENPVQFETPVQKRIFSIEINKNKTCVAIPSTEFKSRMPVTKEMIRSYITTGFIRDWKPYVTAIGEYIKSHYRISSVQNKTGTELPYIFIIDEINRGEISKIFGELFFSVDPGYRGKDGKVKTQYANMQEGETIFDSEEGQGWFYIPENVYILGTMNDIDRSVESFDFAMRRRFVWKEVTADNSATNMKLKETLGETALNKMQALNKEIAGIEELGQQFQIGAAYFLKLKDYKTTDNGYDKLWALHIEPLLREYIRALPDPNKILKKLERAYSLEKEDE